MYVFVGMHTGEKLCKIRTIHTRAYADVYTYVNIDTCIHNQKQTCINSCVPKCLHPLSLALILCVYVLSLTLPICAHSLSRS